MAIHLSELIAAKQKQAKEEEIKSSEEHMSLEELRKLMGSSEAESEKQTTLLDSASTTLKEQKAISLTRQVDEKRTDEQRHRDSESTNEHLKKLNTNFDKLAKKIEKQQKSIDNLLKANEKAKDITGAALDKPQRLSFGERLKGSLQKFTPTGILRSIESKTSGGLFTGAISNIAGRAADIRQRTKDIQSLNPSISREDAKRQATSQIRGQETAQKEARKNETAIRSMQERTGITDEEMAKTRGGRQLLGERVRIAGALQKSSITSIIKKPQQTSEHAEPASKEGALAYSDESDIESTRETSKQTELLAKIEENTRPHAEKEERPKPKEKEEESGNGIPGLGKLGKWGKRLGKVGKWGSRLLGRMPLGSMALAAAPMAAMYGVTKWAEHASIRNEKGEMTGTGKALDTASKVVGGDGVKPEAEMSSAEKMDKDTKSHWWEVGGKDKKIKRIQDQLERGVQFSKEEAAVIKKNLDFDIPTDSIKQAAEAIAPAAASAEATAAPVVQPPTPANAVYNKSAENASAAHPQLGTPPVIVNAPTSVNNTSTQNVTMPAPIRNRDSGFSDYVQKSASFV